MKKRIKKLLGPANLRRIKHIKANIKHIRGVLPGQGPKFHLYDTHWSEPTVFSLPGKHVFFGYYDIQQLNTRQDKLLVTVVPKNANAKADPAELKWVDTAAGEFHPIAQSRAWCWQQGARLRWHPVLENTVLFNDLQDGRYVTRIFDLAGNRELSVLPRAMYDVTADFRYGLSLNYSRLQRLRPGYGYSTLPDNTVQDKVPAGDGIFLVDLQTAEEKLIVSYDQLVKLTPEAAGEWNYINHISIAPDGNRFLFFHIWTPSPDAHWHMKLYTAKMDGSGLTCLESGDIISHYCWRNENELLATTNGFGKTRSRYLLYDIPGGTCTMLPNAHLMLDGHPGFLPNRTHFITDTYPRKDSMQHLFCDSVTGEDYQPICDIYSDPRQFDEKRCDLHPRLTPDGSILTIDSTFQNGTRSVLLFRRKSVR